MRTHSIQKVALADETKALAGPVRIVGLGRVRYPQKRDVFDPATDAGRGEIDRNRAQDLLAGDRSPQHGVGIVDEPLERRRVRAVALRARNVLAYVDLRNHVLEAVAEPGGGMSTGWIPRPNAPAGRSERRKTRDREDGRYAGGPEVGVVPGSAPASAP